MHKTEISIIIPVYKVEPYLNRCVDSILAQTFTDYELILIDDGSPDKCGEICDRYAKIDERITVIHRKNGGLSAARNTGIDIARGRYLAFVDSDDWIDPTMYETLYSLMKKYNADIAVCGVTRIDLNSNKTMNLCEDRQEFLMDQDDAFRELFSPKDRIKAYAWNKIYKKEIFDSIRYPEGVTYEDVYTISDILLKSKKICGTEEALYNYCKRDGSITQTSYNKTKMHSIMACTRTYNIIRKYYPQYADNVRTNLCFRCFLVLDSMLRSDMECVEEWHMIASHVKKEFFYIIKNKRITIKRKLFVLRMMFGRKFVVFCMRLKRVILGKK